MLNQQLRRIHELVGQATTLWNQAEQLWYLIFTLLMHETKRGKVDVIYDQFQTGAMQRQLILAVAKVALEFDPNQTKRNPVDRTKKMLQTKIGQLHAKTNDLSGRRNAVVHSAFEIGDYFVPPRIVPISPHKPSKLYGKDIGKELIFLIKGIRLLVLDLSDFREELGNFTAPDFASTQAVLDQARQRAGLPSLRDARQTEREQILQAEAPHTPPLPETTRE